MTTVVTGATGFLGSALVTELIKCQQTVHILARDENKARQQFDDEQLFVAQVSQHASLGGTRKL